jgi:hypothetical protein
VAGLTTLKGSAPASTDNIYIYNGATLTVESALSILKIYLGQTSSGAAGANNRYGILTVNGGVTITFAGNATATNSGIQVNPTSADASSRGCQLNINGTPLSNVVLTNSTDALNTNNKWTITGTYGTITADYAQFKYTWSSTILTLGTSSAYNNATHRINNCQFGINLAANHIIQLVNAAISQVIDIRFNTFTPTVTNTYGIGGSGLTSCIFASGGEIRMDGCILSAASGLVMFWSAIYQTTGIYQNHRMAYADIRPTQVVPTGLTFTNLQDGTVRVEVSNISSIAPTDLFMVFDASNNRRYSIPRVRYEAALDRKPANCGIIAGVPLSAMTGWYAQYTSDNSNFSSSSSVAGTVTPTLLPTAGNIREGFGAGQLSAEIIGAIPNNRISPNTTYPGTQDLPLLSNVSPTDTLEGAMGTSDKLYSAAEEAARNVSAGAGNIIVGASEKIANVDIAGTYKEALEAKVELGYQYGAGGTEYTGTLPSGTLDAPDKPTGLTATAQSATGINLTWDFTVLAAEYDVYRDNVKIATVEADHYTDTGRTANTEYTYKIKAVNDAGESPFSDSVSATTKQEAVIETRIERGIKEAIESMTVAGGYMFDWQASSPRDEGLLETNDYPCAVTIKLDTEDNQDATREGSDSGYYVNHLNVDIETVQLISETDNPAESIKDTENKMLHDLKRLFGIQYYISSEADCLTMNYVTYERRSAFNGDIAKPARLLTKWRVEYMQNRTEPTQTI